jgi:hypothetical protein
LSTLLSHHCKGSAKYSFQTCSIVCASPDSTGTHFINVSQILSERDKQHPLLGIRYIPEALVLTDALLQSDDDEHLFSPLLLPPCEDETNNKEGCISRGGFKSVITQASWSHKSPTVRHNTHSFGSRLSIRYSSVLMFNV